MGVSLIFSTSHLHRICWSNTILVVGSQRTLSLQLSFKLINMRYSILTSLLAGFASNALAVGVTGAAEGFAKGVTGGGSAAAVYPTTNDQLVSYLGDSSARVIVLQKTFDFTGTEGTTTGKGCLPWGTGSACQVVLPR